MGAGSWLAECGDKGRERVESGSTKYKDKNKNKRTTPSSWAAPTALLVDATVDHISRSNLSPPARRPCLLPWVYRGFWSTILPVYGPLLISCRRAYSCSCQASFSTIECSRHVMLKAMQQYRHDTAVHTPLMHCMYVCMQYTPATH